MARKSAHKSYDLFWKDYFSDPAHSWCNRRTAVDPDLKHKITKEAFWIDGSYNPCWVHGKLRNRAHDDAQVTHVKDFVTLLRVFSKNKDLRRGTSLHDDILQLGFLEQCSDALVTMYAKCGELSKAQELLDLHKSRDVFSWTALIAGYTHNGQGQDALNCFERMQREGLSPDAVTFACILKACGSVGAADIGRQVHDEIARQGLLKNDIVLGNALVDMYAKCGALVKARRVLEELPTRNAVSWSALIGGYAQQGQGEQALKCFDWMQHEGISPDSVTFACILKACGSVGACNKGERIHDEIARRGLLENNIVLGNALVDMYAKCGALVKARQVLEELPVRDVVSWNALITGYVQHDQGEQALNCFERMQCDSVVPNTVTLACVLKACGSIGACGKGEQIHDTISREGLLGNSIVLGNALVDMYAKCGALTKAQQVLEELPVRDVASWNTLIGGYAQEDQGEQALSCFERMLCEGFSPDTVTFACILKACGSIGACDKGEQIHDEVVRQGLLGNNIVLGTALVDMYAKCGAFVKARQVMEELPIQNATSWSALIAGYTRHGQGEEALHCFEEMQCKGLAPDVVTYVCILAAYGSIGAVDKGEEIHYEISRQGLLKNNVMLGNALVDMYAKCGALGKAQRVLEGLPVRNVVCWSALIAGYVQQNQGEQALNCFEQMQCEGFSPDSVTFASILKACGSIGACDEGERIHDVIARQGLLENNIVLGNALVDMYVKCGVLAKAQQVLEELSVRDVVSWNSLISGYAQQGQGEQALHCFEQMRCEGLSPDTVTFASILKACGSIGAGDKGKQIHDEIAIQGLLANDIVLGSALVDMYAKCGALTKAHQMLEELPLPDVVSWSALIAGYAHQGQGERALDCFEQMQHEGVSPNAVAFLCVLNACSLLGLVDHAEMYFANMSTKYGMKPSLEHYTCMVDLFGRVGHIDKAIEVIQKMPSCNFSAVWSALLGACRKWGDVNVGRWAFERAVQVDEDHAAAYVLMDGIHAASGMQEDADKIVAMRIGN